MSIRADIEHFFEKHPHEKHYLKDLAEVLGYDQRQVQQAISWMIRHESPGNIEVVIRGTCWIYKPGTNVKAGSGYMAIVTTTPRGSQILEDDDGNLWIARKFEE
jgi:hypothetical protein